MYTPHVNAEHDLPTLHQFLRGNPLCTLVTQTESGMVASHIPMVLHANAADATSFGTLRGHVARGNHQWSSFVPTAQALGIFTGPQHYITPSWYPEKTATGKVVPTWNYVAVHVYGTLRAVEDPAWILEHLHSLTNTHESEINSTWKVSDAPAEFISKMAHAIVGLELEVVRVEGKWKVSQNQNDRNAAGVITGLEKLNTPASQTMSNLIRSRRLT